MVKDIKLEVNGEKIPMNDFIRKVITRTIMAIVGSLKGINEDEVKNVLLSFSLEDDGGF